MVEIQKDTNGYAGFHRCSAEDSRSDVFDENISQCNEKVSGERDQEGEARNDGEKLANGSPKRKGDREGQVDL